MFGSVQRESELRASIGQALETYCSLVKVADFFWDQYCQVITKNIFRGAIRVVDKANGVFSIMGFLVTASFSPVANESDKIIGKITFQHEKTDICKILFDTSGRVLAQTCSDFSLCNMLDNDGIETIVFDFVGKFIASDILKEK